MLQEKEIKPLGDTRSITVDVRIIASTNQDLEAKIKKGEFREDFFYRLNVLPIRLPSLREHREDIPLIANHLLEKQCAVMGRPLKRISAELMQVFMGLGWAGNVRELENLIMRGISFASGSEIQPKDVGIDLPATPRGMPAVDFGLLSYKDAKQQILQQFNAQYIGRLLSECKGNVSHAARLCGLERQALQQIIRRYGIQADEYR